MHRPHQSCHRRLVKHDGWIGRHSFSDVIAYFINPSASAYQFTLEVLRLPRITLAILAGTALGLSGLLLQNVLKILSLP